MWLGSINPAVVLETLASSMGAVWGSKEMKTIVWDGEPKNSVSVSVSVSGLDSTDMYPFIHPEGGIQ